MCHDAGSVATINEDVAAGKVRRKPLLDERVVLKRDKLRHDTCQGCPLGAQRGEHLSKHLFPPVGQTVTHTVTVKLNADPDLDATTVCVVEDGACVFIPLGRRARGNFVKGGPFDVVAPVGDEPIYHATRTSKVVGGSSQKSK